MRPARGSQAKKGWLLTAALLALVFVVFARRVIRMGGGSGFRRAPSISSSIPGAGAVIDARKRGEAVYYKHCSVCHSPDSDVVIVGPSLKNYFQKPGTPLSNGTAAPQTDAAIRDLLQHGTRNMPPISQDLSGQETADLLIFLHTL